MATNFFPTYYQEFIHLSRYSRWVPEKNRRENWGETVDRYFTFFDEHLEENYNFKLDEKTRKELKSAVLDLRVMPSMRCLMTAGEALKRENFPSGLEGFSGTKRHSDWVFSVTTLPKVDGS